jgi:hypothetical protein
MLIITPEKLIETLKHYQPDETLLVTWWSAEDVGYILSDADVETDTTASDIWEAIVDDLDNNTSDYVISQVNSELDARVYEQLENK